MVCVFVISCAPCTAAACAKLAHASALAPLFTKRILRRGRTQLRRCNACNTTFYPGFSRREAPSATPGVLLTGCVLRPAGMTQQKACKGILNCQWRRHFWWAQADHVHCDLHTYNDQHFAAQCSSTQAISCIPVPCACQPPASTLTVREVLAPTKQKRVESRHQACLCAQCAGEHTQVIYQFAPMIAAEEDDLAMCPFLYLRVQENLWMDSRFVEKHIAAPVRFHISLKTVCCG